eukprot:GDKJ01045387.1.p1 GENE.GDKJ01045387.1~~GDKJ01045387.1.p1  ORF type:complete len:195 (+),score=29.36 GDKJ01045387.1:81-665(+)
MDIPSKPTPSGSCYDFCCVIVVLGLIFSAIATVMWSLDVTDGRSCSFWNSQSLRVSGWGFISSFLVLLMNSQSKSCFGKICGSVASLSFLAFAMMYIVTSFRDHEAIIDCHPELSHPIRVSSILILTLLSVFTAFAACLYLICFGFKVLSSSKLEGGISSNNGEWLLSAIASYSVMSSCCKIFKKKSDHESFFQ